MAGIFDTKIHSFFLHDAHLRSKQPVFHQSNSNNYMG